MDWRCAVAKRGDPRRTREKMLKKRMSSRAASYLLNRHLARSMEAWVELRQQHVAMRRGMVRLLKRELTRGWYAWKELVEAMRVMLRGAAFLSNRMAAMAMNAWVACAERQRSRAMQQAAMARALRHLLHGGMSRGWVGWASGWQERRRVLRALSGAAGHLLHRELSRGWSVWRERARSARDGSPEDGTAAAARHWLHRALAFAVDAWWGVATQSAAMRRSLSYLLNRSFSRAWCAWTEAATERADKLRRGLMVANWLVHRGLALAFACWRDGSVRRAEQYSRATRHLLHSATARGWTAWHEQWSEVAQERSIMRRALKKLLKRQISLGFDSWAAAAMAQKRVERLLRTFLAKCLNRSLALAFATWEESLVPKAVDKYANRMLGRASAHLTRGLQLRGWNAWLGLHTEAQARKRIARVLGYAFNKQLARGIGAWSEMAHDRATFLLALRRGLSKLVSRALAAGFETWRAAMVPRDDPMARALVHMSQRVLCAGWVSWQRTWRELRRALGLLRRVLCGQIAKGWRAWVEAARARRKLGQSVRQIANRTIAPAWNAWLARIPELKHAQLRMRRSLLRMQNSHLTRGWATWLEMAEERAERLRLIRNGLSKVLNRQAALAFSVWRLVQLLAALARVPSPERMPRRPYNPYGRPPSFDLSDEPEELTPREFGGKVTPERSPRRPSDAKYGGATPSPKPQPKKLAYGGPASDGYKLNYSPKARPTAVALRGDQLTAAPTHTPRSGSPRARPLPISPLSGQPRSEILTPVRRQLLSPRSGQPRRPGTPASPARPPI